MCFSCKVEGNSPNSCVRFYDLFFIICVGEGRYNLIERITKESEGTSICRTSFLQRSLYRRHNSRNNHKTKWECKSYNCGDKTEPDKFLDTKVIELLSEKVFSCNKMKGKKWWKNSVYPEFDDSHHEHKYERYDENSENQKHEHPYHKLIYELSNTCYGT